MKFNPQKLRIRISTILGIAVVAFVVFSKNISDNVHPLFMSIFFTTGLICVAIATLGRLWCSLYIAGYKSSKLITDGPYSLCRNPLYFFSLIGLIGVGFCSETFTLPVILVIFFLIYYPIVIKLEEKKLRERHIDAYEKYFSSTPRFFPKFSGFKEPDSYEVKPKIFRKHLFDALIFIWCVGILEIIETLQELEILPSFWNMY